MSEAEIIHDAEVIGTELEPVTHGNLFRTDEPAEIIRRATETADALSQVLRDRKLTVNIQGRDHVKVEGWTLLGTMLGVFPVVEWTRPVDGGGWEARVEARTLAGSVVGAAEAECLRSEKEWGPTPSKGRPREDYALRSMAQTRAVSKALRGPLGFVVTLAGFDPTPAEEMPREGFTEERRTEGPPPLKPPSSWAKLTEMVGAYDPQVNEWFGLFVKSAARLLFPDAADLNKMPKGDKAFLFQKCAGAAVHLREAFDPNEAPPPGLEDLRAAFARVLDGQELAIPEPSDEEES